MYIFYLFFIFNNSYTVIYNKVMHNYNIIITIIIIHNIWRKQNIKLKIYFVTHQITIQYVLL